MRVAHRGSARIGIAESLSAPSQRVPPASPGINTSQPEQIRSKEQWPNTSYTLRGDHAWRAVPAVLLHEVRLVLGRDPSDVVPLDDAELLCGAARCARSSASAGASETTAQHVQSRWTVGSECLIKQAMSYSRFAHVILEHVPHEPILVHCTPFSCGPLSSRLTTRAWLNEWPWHKMHRLTSVFGQAQQCLSSLNTRCCQGQSGGQVYHRKRLATT